MNERLSDDIAALMTAVGIVAMDAVVRAGHKLNRFAMRACPPYALHHDRKIYRMMVIEPACGGVSQFNVKAKKPICHNAPIRVPRQR